MKIYLAVCSHAHNIIATSTGTYISEPRSIVKAKANTRTTSVLTTRTTGFPREGSILASVGTADSGPSSAEEGEGDDVLGLVGILSRLVGQRPPWKLSKHKLDFESAILGTRWSSLLDFV